jgi:hypothetical protein
MSFERDLIASFGAVSTQILENQIVIMLALAKLTADAETKSALVDAVAATSNLIDGEDGEIHTYVWDKTRE